MAVSDHHQAAVAASGSNTPQSTSTSTSGERAVCPGITSGRKCGRQRNIQCVHGMCKTHCLAQGGCSAAGHRSTGTASQPTSATQPASLASSLPPSHPPLNTAQRPVESSTWDGFYNRFQASPSPSSSSDGLGYFSDIETTKGMPPSRLHPIPEDGPTMFRAPALADRSPSLDPRLREWDQRVKALQEGDSDWDDSEDERQLQLGIRASMQTLDTDGQAMGAIASTSISVQQLHGPAPNAVPSTPVVLSSSFPSTVADLSSPAHPPFASASHTSPSSASTSGVPLASSSRARPRYGQIQDIASLPPSSRPRITQHLSPLWHANWEELKRKQDEVRQPQSSKRMTEEMREITAVYWCKTNTEESPLSLLINGAKIPKWPTFRISNSPALVKAILVPDRLQTYKFASRTWVTLDSFDHPFTVAHGDHIFLRQTNAPTPDFDKMYAAATLRPVHLRKNMPGQRKDLRTPVSRKNTTPATLSPSTSSPTTPILLKAKGKARFISPDPDLDLTPRASKRSRRASSPSSSLVVPPSSEVSSSASVDGTFIDLSSDASETSEQAPSSHSPPPSSEVSSSMSVDGLFIDLSSESTSATSSTSSISSSTSPPPMSYSRAGRGRDKAHWPAGLYCFELAGGIAEMKRLQLAKAGNLKVRFKRVFQEELSSKNLYYDTVTRWTTVASQKTRDYFIAQGATDAGSWDVFAPDHPLPK
ncbi:hypothetical protein CC1G_13170 [Coprinopsis cinerea okayama7|uniref:Uncharacterized protein n=1 Tax=Coprinopsis cinerea (strain Okayama-7 / 130 / ATCC MYA-4618 / FGSC 9003) TaxID=240176 RepID=A8NJA4_COPC7|nr:hypothetical protein CC1G_13170 [Coprinopsis cinerea okayama7\|eukprot:XP_001834181.2 hypothetical protein CC1G_13170 [Coprinopsis cinerea okayama7\